MNGLLTAARRCCLRVLYCAFAFVLVGGCACADQLEPGSFLTPGDNLLVTDTTTGISWLSPTYTAGQGYDSSFVQNLITNYGFEYASESDVLNMINTNFNNPPTGSPGTTSGYQDAQEFFNLFGITESLSCVNLDGPGGVPCPRTAGFTSTTTPGFGGVVDQEVVFVLQYGSNGYDEVGGDSAYDTDAQIGSFLVRPASWTPAAVVPTPEPKSLALLATGMCAAFAWRLRRKAFSQAK